MTLDELLKKLEGKPCEVAGSANAKNQCVDLANAYIRDVLGLPIIEWTNAINFPDRAGSNYEWIKNTPTNIVQRGDIVVWGKPFGKYTDVNGNVQYAGHIAVAIEGTVKNFKSFDQNFPLGTPCHIESHTYSGVLGWLRKKETAVSQPTTSQDIINQSDAFIAVCTELSCAPVKDMALAKIRGLQEEKTTLEDAHRKLDRELTEKSARVEELDRELNKIKEDYAKLEVRADKLSKDNDTLQTEKGKLEESITTLSEELAALKTHTKTGIDLIIQGIKDIFGRR